jgi:hypothetical protein
MNLLRFWNKELYYKSRKLWAVFNKINANKIKSIQSIKLLFLFVCIKKFDFNRTSVKIIEIYFILKLLDNLLVSIFHIIEEIENVSN